MRELHDIFNRYFSEPHRPLVLATLFSVEGSHIYRPGALLALSEDGKMSGSISAGCLENDLRSQAQSLFVAGGSKMIHYGAEEISDSVFGLGLGCGGSVRVLLERLPDNRTQSHLRYLQSALEEGAECVSATLWRPDIAQLPIPPQRLIVAGGECVFETIQHETTRLRLVELANHRGADSESVTQNVLYEETNSDVLLTIHRPQLALTVYGSGAIATALTELAQFLHWSVTVIEAATALEHAQRLPGSCDAVVALTHNDALEARLLQELLPTGLSYVGVLGSRSRIERIVSELKRSHPELTDTHWRKLHAPIGLDIGSESAREIAVSIVSEIVAVTNKRVVKSGVKSLRKCATTVHPRPEALTEYLP